MSQAIVPVCEHIRDNNVRCGSPAMDGFHFCYYHARSHMPARVNGKRKIRVSAIESFQSLQITLTHVAQAILDDEIPPAKAFALVQVLQLSYRAMNNHQYLATNPIELPQSMSHLIDGPKPQHTPASNLAPDTSRDNEASAESVPKKKPRMSEAEFEPWRQILLAGTSHPQYLQAFQKYEEYADQFEKLPEADTA